MVENDEPKSTPFIPEVEASSEDDEPPKQV
jgi:hypothetical protein